MSAAAGSARPICLTIAGFDPSSGAGVTADLKTFAAHDVYGVAAITALTVQSTQGVRAVEPMTPLLLRQTLAMLAEDMPLAGVKIGMLCRAGLAAVADAFLRQPACVGIPTVLDPVLISSSGAALLDREGLLLIEERLLGAVRWITPNLRELALLTGMEVQGRDRVESAAASLAQMAAQMGNTDLHVVVTGGHLKGPGEPEQPDEYVLLPGGESAWVPGEWVETTSTHGTGCAFSSALLCALVAGRHGVDAVSVAKQYVAAALRAAYPVGHGHGPIHHLFGCDHEA
jgi:hydroxymethylpyrimidine/phosphomethylpyrimidine kinase